MKPSLIGGGFVFRLSLIKMKISKQQIIDFTILALRWYLAIYMFDYGFGKITGGQFGALNPEILNTPLKDVDKFHVAWHLFSLDKSFNIIIGITQMIGAILIVINRTLLVGAIFLLPVLFQILLVDVAFTTDVFGVALPIRLSIMILSDLAILFYYKDRMKLALESLTVNVSTKLKYKWWIYLLIPIVGFSLDFVFGAITIPLRMFINWLM